MKKSLVAVAGLVWVCATVLVAQSTPRPVSGQATGTSSRPHSAPAQTKAAPATTATAPSPDEAPKYQAWVKQYCIGCHNSRSASPANNPVNLETASLTDPLPNAATWERVLRKLAVRAMPPQGAKHPTEPEYAAFTTWLAGTLDHARG